ncbi:MAG: hypothetical protein P4M00_15475 [Azospirillaceae bacterium]|nr:hypothetical protein [Azospirillaceae bacterium]
MDIWELDDPAPYYEVVGGGPCTLSTPLREDVTADCTAPARLRRRELFMPGWRASINDTATAVGPDGEIFEGVVLPSGHSQVHFHFRPPFVRFGWVASLIGALGLLGCGIQARRRRASQ